jgi:hypothetical protein
MGKTCSTCIWFRWAEKNDMDGYCLILRSYIKSDNTRAENCEHFRLIGTV